MIIKYVYIYIYILCLLIIYLIYIIIKHLFNRINFKISPFIKI